MKIIIIHNLGSRTNSRPDYLAKYLVKSGNEVHLILWDVPYPISWKNMKHNILNSMKYKKYNREGVIVHKIRRLPFFCPVFNKIMFQNQIRYIFSNNNVDVIISESYISEMEPPKELPLVYSLVDDFEAYAKFYGSWLYKLAFKVLMVKKTIKNQIKRSKSTIVVSDLLVDYAKRYNKNVYKVVNGVESWVLENKIDERKYDFGKHSLVYVSGFDYWSNLPNLLYAVNSIKEDIPDIQLILVGEGYHTPIGKKIVKELGLKDTVTFTGQINDRKELFEIINSCDVCLNLSEKNDRQDSASSIKIFEYSALGKPIISTRLKEVEALHFPNIVFYNDEAKNTDLKRAIKESFDKNTDINMVRSLVQPFTWENIAKQFEFILKNK